MQATGPPYKRLKRLHSKTTIAIHKQVPLATVDDWAAEEDPLARRSAWLVTLPHPRSNTSQDGFPLRAPGVFTKLGLYEALADSCQHPDYANARSTRNGDSVSLDMVGVFFEFHQPAQSGQIYRHRHLAILSNQIRFLPLKRALLKRHGLASHWKPVDGYWAAFRYCWCPSPKKKLWPGRPVICCTQGGSPLTENCDGPAGP